MLTHASTGCHAATPLSLFSAPLFFFFFFGDAAPRDGGSGTGTDGSSFRSPIPGPAAGVPDASKAAAAARLAALAPLPGMVSEL